MRNATTPSQKAECVASESFILDGIFNDLRKEEFYGPRRLCEMAKKRILQQGEELTNLRGPYLPNQDDLSELGP